METSLPILVVRADASSAIGSGHVIRMTALAQAWQQQGGRVLFACAEIPDGMIGMMEEEGFPLHRLPVAIGSPDDLDALNALCHQAAASAGAVVALDGYRFGKDYQSGVKAHGWLLLMMDDDGRADAASADWIVNQNPGAHASLYGPSASTNDRLLEGARYALLRKDFARYAEWHRDVNAEGRNVLVTFGGSDPANLTPDAIGALAGRNLNLRVVVGPGYRNQEAVHAAMERHRHAFRTAETVVNPRSMADLMAWADVAVAAAGSTAWEICFMGLPAIFVQVAANQETVMRSIAGQRLGVVLAGSPAAAIQSLGTAVSELVADPVGRAGLARTAVETVDGFGADRICAQLCGRPELALRRAVSADAEILWEWANDPTTRAQSFQTAPIPLDGHVRWFEARLRDPACHFWVAESGGRIPVGCVRFDADQDAAVVSLNLAPGYRGRGIGRQLLQLACRQYFRTSSAPVIRALIKSGNAASIRTFLSCGFHITSETSIPDAPVLEMIRRRRSITPSGT